LLAAVLFLLQSSDIAQQLESTQNSLDEASAELHALQQQLQDERQAHKQSLAVATAEAVTAQQQLQDEHEAKLAAVHEQQQKELCQLQLAGQRLDGQLMSAKEQLSAALQELESERSSSGKLHQEVTKLHHEFEDACEWA
jgi:septal ring factor EnvC (AmiA/AmiB activator)